MGEMIKVSMPKWGLSMVQGTVSDWLVDEGDQVEKGQEIVEIETDKISNVLESPGSGFLRRITAHSGESLPVAALLGVIADDGASEDEINSFIEREQAEAENLATEAFDPLTVIKSFEWNSLNIRYIDSGEGDNPLICLHGFGGDKNNWQFNLAAIASYRRILALDFPSHGDSTVSTEHSCPSSFAKIVLAIMDHLDFEKADLVGHSMGGLVALKVAQENPMRIGSLTLLAPAGIGADINSGYVDGFAKANSRNELKNLALLLFANKEMVTRQMIADLLKYKRLDGVEAALVHLAAKLHIGGKQVEDLSNVVQTIPTKIFWGKADQILPINNCGQLTSASVEQLECGHQPHIEAAEIVNKYLQG